MDVLKKAEQYLISIKEHGETYIPVFTDKLIPKQDQTVNMPITKKTTPTNTQANAVTKETSAAPVTTSAPEPTIAPEPKFVSPSNTIDPAWKEAKTIDELRACIKDCKECPLGQTRNQFVFGEGNPNADIMIIGEAPGKDEDAQGQPFVGRAGQLLTKILEAIDIKREDVFIANICKCRPPNNRRPLVPEVDTCEPYLMKQIELINPQFLISLGLTSIDTLMKKSHKMADIRGEIMDFHGRRLMVTYHPAALLRNPNWKRPVWEDMKKLKDLYVQWLETED